jgi:hypothetical protein
MDRLSRPPLWASLAAGASAGVFTVAFFAISWPSDLLLALPLAARGVVLAGLSCPRGWKRPERVLLLMAGCTLVFVCVMTVLLLLVS